MEGDGRRNSERLEHHHFNPLPPHGGRLRSAEINRRGRCGFQSTPSAWRETGLHLHRVRGRSISIHSLRMEGDNEVMSTSDMLEISIHSLRMEGDCGHTNQFAIRQHFNPLPPHGGRRMNNSCSSGCLIFQSTPSAWRETKQVRTVGLSTAFQSTPSAWRETLTLSPS